MSTIVVFWIFWGLFWANFMWWENKGWVDSMLRGSAELILYSLPANADLLGTSSEWAGATPIPDSYKKDSVIFQVWVNRHLAIRSPGAPGIPMKANFNDGFSREMIDNETSRVYVVSDPNHHIQIQIARPITTAYQDIVSGLISGGIYIALMFTILGSAIWWVILKSFKPVKDLCTTLQDKPAFDFTPLAVNRLPKEMQALVQSFNRLLERLGQSIAGERRFIADAAHELRTPLAVLSAQAHIALSATTMDEKNNALQHLVAGVDRGARLSEQLLDLARIDSSTDTRQHTSVDISRLINLVLDDCKFFASSKNQLISLDMDVCFVLGDINEIGTLLRNLLDNACRFTEKEGRIAVSCKHAKILETNKICLTISDNGPGIPEEERSRVFDRFYRIAGNGQHGSGIGLSLVARIADSHHAAIATGAGLDGRGFSISIYFDDIENTSHAPA
ncbi:sensor histidine kinase [Undibacterium sp. Di26W]|uniref:sensor histidine kinase n=1 Tax=Undibacterium sp. Di26W TaxID=3413035 RepID=UPI003BF1DACC